jgi:hypothetical protein
MLQQSLALSDASILCEGKQTRKILLDFEVHYVTGVANLVTWHGDTERCRPSRTPGAELSVQVWLV